MSNLTLITGQWHENINQVEKVEPILGGSSGNANLATKQLAENILWLREKLEQNKPIKVGDIYTTTLAHASAAAVATHHGYGTWERFAEGKTLVGLSTSISNDTPQWLKTVGDSFGEYEHKLTIDEMPKHDHRKNDYNTSVTANGDRTDGTMHYGESGTGEFQGVYSTGYSGGDLPHNNVQPSIVIGYWLRTA